jgi:signal transduction histidine kinase
VLVVGLVGLALVLQQSRSQSRRDLVTVFDQRQAIAGALFQGLVSGAEGAASIPDSLKGPTVTKADLVSDGGQVLQAESVYTAQGALLIHRAFVPGAATISASNYQQMVARTVLTGTYISNVLGTATNPSVLMASAYTTPYGSRVQMVQYPIQMLSALLPAYMDKMTMSGGRAFIVDAYDRVIASDETGIAAGAPAPDSALMAAARRGLHGSYRERNASWHYTAGVIPDTAWRIVLAVPDGVLFAPLGGAGAFVPGLLLSLLGLCGVLVLVQMVRARSASERLAGAYQTLEERSAEIEQANAAKSQFLAGMSHELRTPLNGIIGFAELMHDGKVGEVEPTHREFLGDILSSARHLLALINDVLDIAKVEAGKLEFHRELVDVAAVVEEARTTLRPSAEEKQIELTVDVEVDGFVRLDPARFRQVLFNYISNAIKFTSDGGHVEIRVSASEPGELRLEVRDNGIGIGAEDLDKLFSEFGQIGSNRANSTRGTGLGLSLTKRLVEAQGGHVDVCSKLGAGSVFVATIPLPEAGIGGDDENAERQLLLGAVPGVTAQE